MRNERDEIIIPRGKEREGSYHIEIDGGLYVALLSLAHESRWTVGYVANYLLNQAVEMAVVQEE